MKPLSMLFGTASSKSTMSGDQPLASYSMSADNGVTVVELFQSQGCSSCPPANANILKLAQDPNMLVLTYEVTYWDYLGWKDTFGNSAFDQRQREYAQAFNNRSVFTPQVIVNGKVDGVGNNKRELESLVAKGTQGSTSAPTFEIVEGGVTVSGHDGSNGIVLLVEFDPSPVDVSIRAGENRGRTLPHANVVRKMTTVGSWRGGTQAFPIPRSKDGKDLTMAILVQAYPGGPILGAARL